MQAPTPSTAVTSRCCPIRTSSSTLSVPPLRAFKDHPAGRDGRGCPNIKRMRSEARRDKRCSWVNVDDPLLLEYHDREWGVPVHSDPKHFEVLVLSGAQAGLNWSLVLKKREGYRRAFDNFDPEKVARYSEKQTRTHLADPQIIRNRMKIEAAVRNARAFLKIREEFGGFD